MIKRYIQGQTLFSVVIPVYNEEGSIPELVRRIDETFHDLGASYEILFVDDGSSDRSLEVILAQIERLPAIRVIEQRRNFGKAIALNTGFQEARGEIVITMDGDLQDDPKEIPRMLAQIKAGYDLVSGWKRKRHDPWHKTAPSKLFNYVTARISGVALHDFNCGFKMYRREVVESLSLYGEMHRYIPALAHWKGYRVTEIEVEHHARKFGKSKYGVERFLRGMFDFLTIAFLTKYMARPMHFFGSCGFVMVSAGGLMGAYLAALWMSRELFGASGVGAIGSRPLLPFSLLLITIGMLFFATGLLSEMIIYLARQKHPDQHVIRAIHPGGKPLP